MMSNEAVVLAKELEAEKRRIEQLEFNKNRDGSWRDGKQSRRERRAKDRRGRK